MQKNRDRMMVTKVMQNRESDNFNKKKNQKGKGKAKEKEMLKGEDEFDALLG